MYYFVIYLKKFSFRPRTHMFKMGIKFNFNSDYQLRELCCLILSRAFSLILPLYTCTYVISYSSISADFVIDS